MYLYHPRLNRLFLNHVNTNGARKVNPAIKIATDVLSDPTAPSHIQVVYRKCFFFCIHDEKVLKKNTFYR